MPERHEIPEPYRSHIATALQEIAEQRMGLQALLGQAYTAERILGERQQRLKAITDLMLAFMELPPGTKYKMSEDGCYIHAVEASSGVAK